MAVREQDVTCLTEELEQEHDELMKVILAQQASMMMDSDELGTMQKIVNTMQYFWTDGWD